MRIGDVEETIGAIIAMRSERRGRKIPSTQAILASRYPKSLNSAGEKSRMCVHVDQFFSLNFGRFNDGILQ